MRSLNNTKYIDNLLNKTICYVFLLFCQINETELQCMLSKTIGHRIIGFIIF